MPGVFATSTNVRSLPNFSTTRDLFLVTAQGTSRAVAHCVWHALLVPLLRTALLTQQEPFLTAVSKSYIPSLWLQCVFCPSGCKSTYRGEQDGEKPCSPSAYQDLSRFYMRTGQSFLPRSLSLHYQLLTLPQGWAAGWTRGVSCSRNQEPLLKCKAL